MKQPFLLLQSWLLLFSISFGSSYHRVVVQRVLPRPASLSTSLSQHATASSFDAITDACTITGTATTTTAIAGKATTAATAATATACLASLLAMTSGEAAHADTGTQALTGLDLYSRYFFAGGICASFSHTISVPFDVVKTRLQTATTTEFANTNVLAVAQSIVAREGVGILFKGLGPTLLGYLVQGSLKYGFYEVFKPLVAAQMSVGGGLTGTSAADKIVSFMIAGACAELIGSTFLTPFEAARIRLVANPSFAPGIVGCVSRMVDEETTAALFRGLPAILSKQVPYTVVQLSSYEFLTGYVYSAVEASGGSAAVTQYRLLISAGCALVAALLSSLASQPGDTLLSAVNKSARVAAVGSTTASVPQKGPLAIMGETIEELGVTGLFKGTKARLLHVSVIVVTQLLVYDFIKGLCGVPLTGTH